MLKLIGAIYLFLIVNLYADSGYSIENKTNKTTVNLSTFDSYYDVDLDDEFDNDQLILKSASNNQFLQITYLANYFTTKHQPLLKNKYPILHPRAPPFHNQQLIKC